ncbi:hypothetical protein C8Q79DRAFT_969432 [Trametes meyenii]|nr:hypothetical protein C8Q79DRAFT_969432 [Trametes meyenii]
MIVDKQPLPGDELVVDVEDAPPSYDALDNVPPPLPRVAKSGGSTPHSCSSEPNSAASPLSPKSPSALPGKNASGGKRPPASWFNFGPSSRAAKEVRATIQGLLRDLVKQTDASGALGVLDSCADACRSYDLSLATLLQERSLEGHTPIYWAIINRPSATPAPDQPDIVTALLTHAAPLSDATVDELRLACLHTSDHGLFQRLRRSPAFAPLSGADEIILGGNVPVDDVEVEDVPNDEAGFVAHVRIPVFQKRMRISQTISLEFIAKGRLWALRFVVANDSGWDSRFGYKHIRGGSWVPPTWVDSRLVIEDPRARTHPPPVPLPSGPPSSLLEAVEGMLQQAEAEGAPSAGEGRGEGAGTGRGAGASGKPKPPIELRMRLQNGQLTAPASIKATNHSVIAESLEDNPLAHSLQFKGCPYIESDGSLVARLEARLVQPGSDCVIC